MTLMDHICIERHAVLKFHLIKTIYSKFNWDSPKLLSLGFLLFSSNHPWKTLIFIQNNSWLMLTSGLQNALMWKNSPEIFNVIQILISELAEDDLYDTIIRFQWHLMHNKLFQISTTGVWVCSNNRESLDSTHCKSKWTNDAILSS